MSAIEADAKQAGGRLLRELLRRERRAVAITIACSVLAAVFEGAGLGLLIPLLKNVSDPGAEAIRVGVGWVDTWLLAADKPPVVRLYQVSGLILISIVLRTALSFIARATSIKATERALHNLREQIFDRLLNTALPFYTASRGGDLVNGVTVEVNRLRTLLQALTSIVTRGLVMLAYVVFAVAVSWTLTVTVVAFLGLMAWGLRPIVAQARQRGRIIAWANGALAAAVAEFIGGVRTVMAFNGQAYERKRFSEASEFAASRTAEMSVKAAMVRPIGEALASAVLIGLVVVSMQMFVLSGELSVAAFLAFLFALFRLFPLVHELNNQRGVVAAMSGAWEHVADLLSPDNKPSLTDGTQEPGPLTDGLVFDHVTFAYAKDEPVLHDVSLSIHKGETVAFVGGSGAGKSTLADLIPRFHDPVQGRVLLDGVDLRDLKMKALRGKLAVVSQDTFLFHDTVTANITYGLDDVPMERIRWAAEQANALGFIEAMPEGFDTVLGDRGARLSGGQRQRIAIARALLRDPEFLILDEATSALDSVSEQQVQQSLERLMEGRTALVIAHRLSTIERADRVVVMEHGRVVEEGTYEDLLAQRGKLWEYHRIQNQAA